MITRSNKDDDKDTLEYKKELSSILSAINNNLNKKEPIYFLFNKNEKFKFDQI
ncbi:hypothetical protein DF16_pBMB400orf00377 (plasmid) [Bacillus thuringiensis serovar kurstaki str. YBT-1520]|nr:hypothetical protein DF16_pBMB400orf00377 [Bacillus thuringiensis serovar kurstaki str. YBT-1520]